MGGMWIAFIEKNEQNRKREKDRKRALCLWIRHSGVFFLSIWR